MKYRLLIIFVIKYWIDGGFMETKKKTNKNQAKTKTNNNKKSNQKRTNSNKDSTKIKLPESTIMKDYKKSKEQSKEKEIKGKKKKRKLKKKNAILLLLMIIAFAFLIYSGVFIIRWFIDNKNTQKMTEQIQEKVVIDEMEDKEGTEVVEPEVKPPETDPYWDYIKMNLIDVDFTELKAINSETKGWIQVNGTQERLV